MAAEIAYKAQTLAAQLRQVDLSSANAWQCGGIQCRQLCCIGSFVLGEADNDSFPSSAQPRRITLGRRRPAHGRLKPKACSGFNASCRNRSESSPKRSSRSSSWMLDGTRRTCFVRRARRQPPVATAWVCKPDDAPAPRRG